MVIKMATKKTNTMISTNARIILGEWNVLAALVAKHTTLTKERIQAQSETSEEAAEKPNILSIRQIEDALNGPYQDFFKQKLSAYSSIYKLQLAITLDQEEAFKNRFSTGEEKPIPKELLSRFSVADLEKMRKQLDELTTEHNQQWEAFSQQAKDLLKQTIADSRMQLSDIEINEFSLNEPQSELLDRFTVLSITPPKQSKAQHPLTYYLNLKTYLTLHSALSRQHLPHEKQDIENAMKPLKANFGQTNKLEKQLLLKQFEEAHEIVRYISF